MGTLFRRYWIPALLAEELAENDGEPVRVRLLSEDLIAFRDTDGKIGLIDEFCAHRRVSLWFGRNEDNGLRCPYHGWKYDVTGQCVDIPSELPESELCERVTIKAYPCVELGGVIWTYMGPKELQPPTPEFEWTQVPDANRYVSKRFQESNYLQALEGGIDSSHVSSLHSGELEKGFMHRGTKSAKFLVDRRPKFEATDSPAGMLVAARRAADEGQSYWRVTQWIMPWYTIIPPIEGHAIRGHAWVPIDDEHCFTWTMAHHPTRPLGDEELHNMKNEEGHFPRLIPGTYQSVANKSNGYLMNRAEQKKGRFYSGVEGVGMQDASLQENMGGPIVDRSLERLVATDIAIVKARRRLIEVAENLRDGTEPPGLDPATHHVRSASFIGASDLDLTQVEEFFTAKEGTLHTAV
jgi:phenylpropionate dioxygenase-like ring-hydroxylating dioxygenase large terminal subunit